jgi:hypothetical protein
MLLTTAAFQRCFQGFTIIDCVVRRRDIFYFVALDEYDTDDVPPADPDRQTRIVVYFGAEAPNERWAKATCRGLNGLVAGAALLPREQFVGVDADGQVLVMGSGTPCGMERSIPGSRNGPLRGGIRKLRTIDGRTYASTGYRGLGRREDKDSWTTLCDTLTFDPDPNTSSLEYGFDDFDAFDPGDIYCVGGSGDVWHFDGRAFRQIEFPTDGYLVSVCCAGDGFVYIGGEGGSVWKGRDDSWSLIHRGGMSLPFKDMVWFQDRVYCTSDYGLWEIEKGKLREAAVPDAVKICSGNLSVADEVMLLAGAFGAAYHDGSSWTPMFDTMTFTGPNPPA